MADPGLDFGEVRQLTLDAWGRPECSPGGLYQHSSENLSIFCPGASEEADECVCWNCLVRILPSADTSLLVLDAFTADDEAADSFTVKSKLGILCNLPRCFF